MLRRTYVVEDGQGSDNGVDEVDTHETACLVGSREEGHQGTTDDAENVLADYHIFLQNDSRRDNAGNDPCPAVRLLPDSKSDTKGEENADDSRRHVHKSGLLRVITQVADQGG